MPAPLLRYALQLAQGASSNLTYVNVGESARLTLVVANPGNPVTLESITVAFPPFGPNATDLVQSDNAVSAPVSTDWVVVPGTSFELRPAAGSVVVGTAPLTFTFEVAINPTAGIAEIGITEVTTAGTGFLSPAFAVTKMPADFALTNLIASPTLLEPNGTVTLTWTGTPAQKYTVTWIGGTAVVTAPSDGVTSWTSSGVETTFPAVTFTVDATRQADGDPLSVEASTTVTVDLPQILSFAQPAAPFFSTPVPLSWQTQNADCCKLFANGRLIDGRAPAVLAQTAAYNVYPSARSTQYSLYAVRQSTSTLPSTATVNLYTWRQVSTVWLDTVQPANDDGEDNGSTGGTALCTALAFSPDGGTLYYASPRGIYAIDTARNQIVAQTPLPYEGESGLAPPPVPAYTSVSLEVSGDGSELYLGVWLDSFGLVYTISASNLTGRNQATVGGQLIAVDPSGAHVFCLSGAVNPGGEFIVLDGQTLAPVNTINFGAGTAYGLVATQDGTRAYYAYQNVNLSRTDVWRYDVASATLAAVAQTPGGPVAISRDGGWLYYVGPRQNGQLVISELSLPAETAGSSFAIGPADPNARVDCITCDESGSVYALVATSSGATLWFIDPVSGATHAVPTAVPSGAPGSVCVSGDGSRVYAAGFASPTPLTQGAVLVLATNAISPSTVAGYRYDTLPTPAAVI